MSTILKSCHCGYEGELHGMQHQGLFLSLACPQCKREVTAFTKEGLAEFWNKPPLAAYDPLDDRKFKGGDGEVQP